MLLNRRNAIQGIAAATLTSQIPAAQASQTFNLRYMLASSMYGKTKIDEILPEVSKTGSEYIDIWPMGHANQREQIEAMGHDAFAGLLAKHNVKVGLITRYDLGPFRLQDEMRVVKKFGGHLLVCGAKNANGDTLKEKVAAFVEALKPHVAVAEELGVTIAIENHGNSLISSPDSIRYFCDMAPSRNLGVALAPYHLPQDEGLIAELIEHAEGHLAHFYAWQHGMGCHKPMPKAKELLQMPGVGVLDFAPILKALSKVDYDRHVEVFMHPTPRGIPILETTDAVSGAINDSRAYLARAIARSGV